jgi:hypothetical protein
MLTLVVQGVEHFDDSVQQFLTKGDVVLELEHSLVSLSKWESEYEKPFLSKDKKTTEEVIGYVKAMTLNEGVSSDTYYKLKDEHFEAINQYVDQKMTATWINEPPGAPRSKEIITAELIYYWMVVFQIPFECQHWHLNRLFTLIRVCNNKQAKPKKMSAKERRELNAARRAQLGTKG